MGVVGMLFFIPFTSVVYTIFRQYVNRRLNEKNIVIQ
jgi:predicted PurR-regulated permease PerM